MSPLHHYRDVRLGAIAFCRHESATGDAIWHNLCQKGTRTALGAGPGAISARAAWEALPADQKRHPGDRRPPRGVPVYFRLNTPFWHAAISAGDGNIWSTDILRRGCYDKVSIGYLERRWNAEYLGWATHINSTQVW